MFQKSLKLQHRKGYSHWQWGYQQVIAARSFFMSPPCTLEKHLTEKIFCFEMWWCFGITTVLTVVQGSSRRYLKAQCPVLGLESCSNKGSSTFAIALSPSWKMLIAELPASHLGWVMLTWDITSASIRGILGIIVWAL